MTTAPRSPKWITVFGLGSMRPAPGTWGSLPPVVVAGLLWLGGMGPVQNPWLFYGVQAAFLLVFSIACVLEGPAAEVYFGKKDPSNAVADETAGQTLSLFFLPAIALSDFTHAAITLSLAFLGFRFFDIIKPWPAYRLQKLPAGWGILVDDLFAGLYAAAAVQIITRFLM